jgi:hypothetical protein
MYGGKSWETMSAGERELARSIYIDRRRDSKTSGRASAIFGVVGLVVVRYGQLFTYGPFIVLAIAVSGPWAWARLRWYDRDIPVDAPLMGLAGNALAAILGVAIGMGIIEVVALFVSTIRG